MHFGFEHHGLWTRAWQTKHSRWQERTGAFYPFARNHNALGRAPQEAYRWQSTRSAARNALRMRYSFLPYLYTLFAHAHRYGGTVARPAFWHAPKLVGQLGTDSKLAQWLWGSSLLVAPVLEQGADSREAWLPPGQWLCWGACDHVEQTHEHSSKNAAAEQRNAVAGDQLQHRVNSKQSSFLQRMRQTVTTALNLWLRKNPGNGSVCRQTHGGRGAAQRQASDAATESPGQQHAFSGPSTVHIHGVSLGQLPLWLKMGAILPMVQNVDRVAANWTAFTAERMVVNEPLHLLVLMAHESDGALDHGKQTSSAHCSIHRCRGYHLNNCGCRGAILSVQSHRCLRLCCWH